jgi:hypothetical protein
MKCLACGFIDDYESFLFDYDYEGNLVSTRCPECGNDDPNEMSDTEFEDEDEDFI